ncbi:basic proline-rich protein-like [Acinonyx jubatus]|uniref:Basic proline-rich protein-like n=1 Tax=Acinonyx jubatus TaxID=32536 RepID=A0ABM3NGU0_ACIJB|nr:basic proline-rich protein-like [Acinonyx jubatus]
MNEGILPSPGTAWHSISARAPQPPEAKSRAAPTRKQGQQWSEQSRRAETQFTQRIAFVVGDQPHAKLAPAPPAGPRGRTPGCRAPDRCSGVPSLRILGSWGPRGVRGLAARVRPSASQPWWRPTPGARHPARGQRSSPLRAGGGPGAASRAPPGLRGPEPESRRHTPSPPGFQCGAPSVPQRRAPAQQAPPVSTARPLFPAWVSAAPAPGRLRGSFARSAPPMEEPELPALRAAPAGGGAAAPAAPPSRRGRGHLGPLPVASALGPAPSSRGRRQPRRGPGPPTGRSPAGAGAGSRALRCPEGAAAASGARVEARRSGRGLPSPLR